jgi:hypothetical protein
MEPTQEEELLVTVSKIVPTHSSNATYGCGRYDSKNQENSDDCSLDDERHGGEAVKLRFFVRRVICISSPFQYLCAGVYILHRG